MDPKGNLVLMASCLEFGCTNNTIEYEGLLQGLLKVIDMKVKFLKVYGHSEIVVKQVRNIIHCNSHHLQRYQHEVWNIINEFDFFNMIVVPRGQNNDVDLMVNIASKLSPNEN